MKIFTAKVKSSMLGVLMICLSALTAACVDEDYNLDNISSEVTIGGEEVVIPLGKMERTSLEQMLGEGLEGLVAQDGVYTVKFEGENEKISVEGLSLPVLSGLLPKMDQIDFTAPSLPADFIFGSVTSSFVLGYPDLGVAPQFAPIEFSAGVNLDLGVNIPSGTIAPALGELSFSNSGKVPFTASFNMPEQIRSVGKIYFGDEYNQKGSPIEVELSFNGLKSVNGGGVLNLTALFPSNYVLVDSFGKVLGNKLEVKNYRVSAGVESVVLKAWLQSIDFSQKSVARGAMNINDEITYEFDYEFESVKGYCDLERVPQIALHLAPAFRDMEIVLNDIVIDNENHTSDIVYTLNGVPESIESIEYIALQSAPITMSIEGLSWLKSDALTAEVSLPKCFIFERDANGWLDIATNKIVAPMRQLERGVTFNLKGIDCSKGDMVLNAGQLSIKAAIQSHISNLAGGTQFMLSEVLPPQKTVNIKTVIEESHMYVDLAASRVKLKEQYFDFKLDEDKLPRIEHTISVPDELVEIDRLEVQTPKGEKVKVKLGISHPEGELFPVDKVYLSLSVNFKKLIHPTDGQQFIEKAPNGDNILRLDHIEWRPNEDAHFDIVEIEVDAIENLPEITGEKGAREIVIDERFSVTGGVSIDAGSNINLEAESAKLNFDFAIDDVQVSKFYGKLDYTFEPENLPAIEIGELANAGLKIENLAVDPVIRFSIDNPVNIPFNASLALKPYDADGNYMASNRVDVEDVHINDGGRTNVVVSTRNRRDEFANKEGVTFVEVDLERLLHGTLPSKIEVELKVASDLSVVHVIDLTKPQYELEYGYSVEIPLEFGHDFDISYEQDVELPEFTLADEDVDPNGGGQGENNSMLSMLEIGEVAILADFTTTIPLDFILSAECFDESGEPSEAQITFEDHNNMIHGHHPEDAEPEAHSSLVLKLDLGKEGKLEDLNNIKTLRLRLNLRNNSHTPSALSPEQYISGKFRLRLRDGITINLNGIEIEE